MQHDSNLRWPPNKTHLPGNNVFYQYLRQPLRTNTSAKKKSFSINFIHLIHKSFQILSTFTSWCYSVLTALIFLTLSHNIPNFFLTILQCVILSLVDCISYAALLNTVYSHLWCDALPCCYDLRWLNNAFIFLGYKLTWKHTEDLQFSPQIVLVVLRI
jgi:hypothetical protein